MNRANTQRFHPRGTNKRKKHVAFAARKMTDVVEIEDGWVLGSWGKGLERISKTEAIRRDAQPLLTKAKGLKKSLRELQDYQFDSRCKSWKGPIRKVQELTKLTRMISNKEKLLDSQKKAMAKLKVNKDAVQATTVDYSFDDDDGEEEASTSDQDPLDEVPFIRRPFSGKLQEVRYTSWKAPALEKIEAGMPLRAREFDWQKPTGGSGAVSFTSPQQQLARMEELLQQKDREVGIIRSQLFKAQEENYKLIQVLQGYTGKHYEELQGENTALRRYLERVMRENAKLAGYQRREGNGTLAKLEHERALNDTFGVKAPCPPIGPNMKAISFKVSLDNVMGGQHGE